MNLPGGRTRIARIFIYSPPRVRVMADIKRQLVSGRYIPGSDNLTRYVRSDEAAELGSG